jgi:hypothetical protein
MSLQEEKKKSSVLGVLADVVFNSPWPCWGAVEVRSGHCSDGANTLRVCGCLEFSKQVDSLSPTKLISPAFLGSQIYTMNIP